MSKHHQHARRRGAVVLRPRRLIEIVESGEYFLELLAGRRPDVRRLFIPYADVRSATLGRLLATRVGLNVPKTRLDRFRTGAESVPRTCGAFRLGWTPGADAFVLPSQTIYRANDPSRMVRFVGLAGTSGSALGRAFRPAGTRVRQHHRLRLLWKRSREARLVLSLAAISPFLEILGAPPLLLHLAGETGYGKTTLARYGISLFGDPNSPLTALDFSKDTPNYADRRLATVKNLPILFDETTLRADADIATSAYSIVAGKTKGRLGGTEARYAPAEPDRYALVVFLTGEAARHARVAEGGGAARWLEIEVPRPLFPRDEGAAWFKAAADNYGWFGADLIASVVRAFLQPQDNRLLARYRSLVERTATWCDDHPRLIDALALVQLGHYLVTRQLFHTFASLSPFRQRWHAHVAEHFAKCIYKRLILATGPAGILAAMRNSPKAPSWPRKGYIPLPDVRPYATRFEMTGRGEFVKFLRDESLVTDKVVSRKTKPDARGNRRSFTAYPLTRRGRRFFQRRTS